MDQRWNHVISIWGKLIIGQLDKNYPDSEIALITYSPYAE